MPCHLLIAQAHWRAEHPVALLQAGPHLLHRLPLVLFPFQLTLSGHDGFAKPSFGRVLKAKVQAFHFGSSRLEFLPQLNVKDRIARKAFEIIEYDYEIITRLRIDKAQKRNHAGALHKITAAGDVIWEDSSYVIPLAFCILTAAMFLAGKARPIDLLTNRRDAAVNHGFLSGFDMVFGCWLSHGLILPDAALKYPLPAYSVVFP
ncbi:MAG: hypothetical protein AAGF88_05565 [Pseudomonadota bacterium]